MSTDIEPIWERRDGESARAYAAFQYYDRLGPSRSVDKAFRLFRQETSSEGAPATEGQAGGGTAASEKKRAPSHWQAWSSANDWVKRAEAHDAHQRFLDAKEAQQDHTHRLEQHRVQCAKIGAEQMELARLLGGIATAEARVHVVKLHQYEKAIREGKKVKRPVLPKGLSTLARAAAHVNIAAQVTQAQALGVEDLMLTLDRMD